MSSNLYTHQSSNVTKTWLLMTVFVAVLVALGWGLSSYFGTPNILYIAIVISIIMNIWAYWFSDKTVLRMSGARPASREEFFDLYTVVENLSITAGLPAPKVYVIDDAVPNAFATGRNKHHAVIAVSTGLLQILDRSELEGVIAHELSHIGNNDMLLSTVIVVLVGVISLVSNITLRGGMLGGGGGNNKRSGGLGAILMLLALILTPLVATLLRLSVSRKREFLADASGALLTRYPEGLARALEKISAHGVTPMRRANSSMAHLYISNPLGIQKTSSFANLFSTHPPMVERVKALRGTVIK